MTLALQAGVLCALVSLSPTPLDDDGHVPSHGALDHALEKSIDALRTRVEQNPDDLITRARLGMLELRVAKRTGEHEDYHAAEHSFRDVLAIDPQQNDAWIGLAYTLLGLHRFQDALEAARSAAAGLPGGADDLRVLALLGDLHLALGNVVEAELAYARLLDAELTMHSLARMAQVHEVRGRYAQARNLYADALRAGELLEEGPETLAWCHTMLGDLAFHQADWGAASAAYERALELEKSSHAAWFRLARVHHRRGEHEEAEHLLTSLVEARPLPRYWVALGDFLTNVGRADEAKHWFELAEKDMLGDLEVGDVGHVRDLAELYLLQGRGEEARPFAELDLREVRHDADTFATLAWARHLTGRSDEAASAARELLRRGPGSMRSLCRAAVVLHASGSELEAAQVFAIAQLHDKTLREESLADPGARLRLVLRRGI